MKPQTRRNILKYGRSRPAGARGLKHHMGFIRILNCRVAPRRGAWIETV